MELLMMSLCPTGPNIPSGASHHLLGNYSFLVKHIDPRASDINNGNVVTENSPCENCQQVVVITFYVTCK